MQFFNVVWHCFSNFLTIALKPGEMILAQMVNEKSE